MPKYIRRAICSYPGAINCLLLLAGLTPIALVTWYIFTRGKPIPVADQWWDLVYIAVKTRTGMLTPEDILVFAQGHRPAIIRLIIAISTVFTDYNIRVLRFVPIAIALLNLGLAVALLRSRQLMWVAFFLFSVVLFTLYHDRSWLDLYFSVWQQSLFFMLLGLLILQRIQPSWLGFALLLCCASAASLSTGRGLAAWICLPIAALGISGYRRPRYLVLWLAAMALFAVFYFSDYAKTPWSPELGVPSLTRAMQNGLLPPIRFLFQFQAARFDTDTTNIVAMWFTLICALMLGANLWQIMRSKEGLAAATLWGSLAVFAIGTAALVVIGRGPPFPIAARYRPGAEGFWLAFIALALLTLSRRPAVPLSAVNIVLLVIMVILTAQKDSWALQKTSGLFSIQLAQDDPFCDRSPLDYPLYRDDRLRKCFIFSEDQSAYHLAALRLSVFRDEKPQLIVPGTKAPVITDMPNRWLSVYVRDYMMAGLAPEKLYSIAPVVGEWRLPIDYSPFYRGEWSTDILPQPLTQTWTSLDAFAPELAVLAANQQPLWYLNTPETEAHLSEIAQILRRLGYTPPKKFPIVNPRYASARFTLWCFERIDSNACALN